MSCQVDLQERVRVLEVLVSQLRIALAELYRQHQADIDEEGQPEQYSTCHEDLPDPDDWCEEEQKWNAIWGDS